MASEGTYYVPEQSKLPIFASLGMGAMAFGIATWINGGSGTIFFMGSMIMAIVLWCWFSTVISENMKGLNDAQLKRSYVWGMGWFIFSEFMFFAAFFGALYYIRNLALPWLSGEGSNATTNSVLWEGFTAQWPLMVTPDMAVNGDAAKVVGPGENMSITTAKSIWTWLPFWNTVVLLTSSITVHIAHLALKNEDRKRFNIFLGATVLLGIIFVILQALEYIHAYDVGLTIDTGAYGTTFFMLTGFHGAHVTIGTFMLLVMWLRSVLKGHFKHEDCFGFEAASWYWHFVDVVWVGLFIFVYILG